MKPLVFCISTLLFFGLIWGCVHYFSVSEVQLNGVKDIRGIEKVYTSFMPTIRTHTLEEELIAINPTLASLSVHKSYPNTLVVTARMLRPAVEVRLADGSAVLSDTGVVLSKYKSTTSEESLPQITFYQPLFYNQMSIGEKVEHSEIQTAAYFAGKVIELGTPVSTIDITNENMIVLHAESYNVIVTSEEDIEVQSVRLTYTFTELRKKGREFSSIDVRFERPIITLKK